MMLKSLLTIGALGTATYYLRNPIKSSDTYWKISSSFVKLLQKFEPERAHRMSILAGKYGLTPIVKKKTLYNNATLSTQIYDMYFPSCIGLAAGYDKHGECINSLFKLGFGFVEIGTITPEPQPGNPKPRLFRLIEDKGFINRFGFNSVGQIRALRNIKDYYFKSRKNPYKGVLGINIGKNKTASDSIADYTKGIDMMGEWGDYIVVNISSPNTPGLRNLQNKDNLESLLTSIVEERDKLTVKRPVFVKIAPDLTQKEREEISNILLKCHVDGIVISNTTIGRNDLNSHHKIEEGGLSGQPLTDLSTYNIREMYKLTKGHLPIIGVGGISNGQQAYEKIKAGASVIQLYSALVYEGPQVIDKISRELAILIHRDGYNSVKEAVGKDVKL